MLESTGQEAILLLEDGTVFRGKAVGKIGTTSGEICFNTGMTGYQEIFTDPSYFGQILVCTNVHIGNYGIKNTEVESDNIQISGMVCRNFSKTYSRNLADRSIQEYFEQEGLVAIEDIDTRALVRHIRSKGAMNAIISSEILELERLDEMLQKVPSMEGLELASKVTTSTTYTLGNPNSKYKIAVLDLGIKKNILRNFESRDCFIKVYPAKTSYEEMLEWNPDGFFLSNGPGDPAAMNYAVDIAKEIIAHDRPLFGICLGHQILALAVGIPTYKMHHGHRGINHPVKNLITGKGEITSQNHGFGVSPAAFEKYGDQVNITHINLNDNTIEGMKILNKKAFSVQYHPEASPGPHDANYLFDQFIQILEEEKQAVVNT